MKKISVKIDQKELIANFWETGIENPRGIFYIHHGMAEHIDRYNYFAEQLNSKGYHVVGHNHLGHGNNKENGEGFFARSEGWKKVCYEAKVVCDHLMIFSQKFLHIYLDTAWDLLFLFLL